jgi:transposase
VTVKVKRTRQKSKSQEFLQKARGVIHRRVQQVGPEHFGIISVDCAKARSKWMLADFYGNMLLAPTEVAHNRVELESATNQVRAALSQHNIQDCLVAIERTGRYHHAVKQAFKKAGFETRIVHPFSTKQFRQPDQPDVKTDDIDLAAIHRTAVNGFALLETARPTEWRELQLLIRHRRVLVQQCSALCCQIREHLDATLPGYAACFDKLWESQVAFTLVRHFGSAQALLDQGLPALIQFLHQQQCRFQARSVQTVLTWAAQAAAPDDAAELHRHIALSYEDDRKRKHQEIQALERTIARRLAQTPYILLLAIPGINVVSAADLAGEAGPITDYANANGLTGRAGLFPSRYQSDRVDRPNGPLVRRANRALRATLLNIADNLILCNAYFRDRAAVWKLKGKDPRYTHVKVAKTFSRVGFAIVAGRQIFRHPCMRDRGYVVDKLLAFHTEHDTPWPETLQDLEHAINQIPRKYHGDEAKPLLDRQRETQRSRRKGPQPLSQILAVVLARLGVGAVSSTPSGDKDLT